MGAAREGLHGPGYWESISLWQCQDRPLSPDAATI